MGNLTKNTITRGAVVALALSAGAATTANAAVTRTSGADRYATATAIFKSWPTTTTTAVLAAGVGHDVDALTVAPLAKMKNAPVILVDTAATPAAIVAQFAAFTTVYIANGNGVVTPAVEAALVAAGKTVVRLGGVSREETALNIAKAIGTANGIVVANGDNAHIVDTLSIASIAAAKGMPIFLTSAAGTLDAAQTTYAKGLGAANVYALGGTTVVTDAAAAGLGTTVTRLFGAGRYETNAKVVTNFKDTLDLTKIYVASGEDANLIDALAGAPLAGLTNSPIVFAHSSLNADVNTLLNTIVTPSTSIVELGGVGAVTADVDTALTAIQTSKGSATLAVSSVSAINLKQIKVVFNKAVDKATAETLANYTLVTGSYTATAFQSADTAKLQADGKSVIITLEHANAGIGNATALLNQTSYTLAVSNVLDTTSNIIASTSTAFTAFDIAVPTVVTTKVLSPTAVQVFFSAPIKQIVSSDFSIDGGQTSVSVNSAVTNDLDYSVILSTGSALVAGSHTLKVTSNTAGDLMGYNNLVVQTTSPSFTVVLVTAAPTFTVPSISLLSSSTTQVQVKFSTPVALKGNADIFLNYNNITSAKLVDSASTMATQVAIANSGLGVLSQPTAGTPIVVDANSASYISGGTLYADTYDVYVNSALPVGNSTIYVDNDKDAIAATTNVITDAWGNTFKSTSGVGSLTVDTTKPIATSVVMDSTNTMNQIDLTFNKTMSDTSVETGSNYTLLDSTGKAVTPATVSGMQVDYNGHPLNITKTGTNTYQINLTASLPAGTYTLAIAGVTDMAQPTSNSIANASFTLKVVDGTNPTAFANAVTGGTDIYVYYSKAMTVTGVGSIVDLANYQYNSLVLPSGTTITALNGNTIADIKLGSGTATVGAPLAIGTVKDALGNVIISAPHVLGQEGIAQGDILVANPAVSANYDSAKATGTNTITFEVDQALSAISSDMTKFGVTGLGPVTGATYVNKLVKNGTINGALVTLTTTGNWTTNLVGVPTVTLGLGALTNSNGNGSAAGLTIAAAYVKDYIAPGYAATAPYTVAADANHLGHIVVTFNEPIQNSSVTQSTFGVAGYNIVDAHADTALNANTTGSDGSLGNTTFDIVLSPSAATNDLAVTPSVTLLAAVKDNSAQHNILAAANNPIATVDKVSPVATLPAVTGATTNSATKLVATFNESLYIAGVAVVDGADVKTSFTAEAGNTITSALYNATTKTITFTFSAAADGKKVTHNADATKLTDAAGNAYTTQAYTYTAAGTIWN